jgi:hypothetical protein
VELNDGVCCELREERGKKYKGWNSGVLYYRHPAVVYCIIRCIAMYVCNVASCLSAGERNTEASCCRDLVSLSVQLID